MYGYEQQWKWRARRLLGMWAITLGCLCCSGITAGAVERKSDEQEAVIVWSQEEEMRFPVYLSVLQAGQWQEPVLISDNEKLNVVPSVTMTEHGTIWVIWSVFSQGDIHLHMNRLDNGLWTGEEKIETGFSSNTSPTVGVDGRGVLWLVWAGHDGQDDEIFFSRWNGFAFEPAMRITDNEVPDVLPVLGLTETGAPWVQWQRFDEDGYQTMTAQWNEDDQSWSSPVQVLEDVPLRQFLATDDAEDHVVQEIVLPDYVTIPESASLYIPGQQVQSLPVRLLEELRIQE